MYPWEDSWNKHVIHLQTSSSFRYCALMLSTVQCLKRLTHVFLFSFIFVLICLVLILYVTEQVQNQFQIIITRKSNFNFFFFFLFTGIFLFYICIVFTNMYFGLFQIMLFKTEKGNRTSYYISQKLENKFSEITSWPQ